MASSRRRRGDDRWRRGYDYAVERNEEINAASLALVSVIIVRALIGQATSTSPRSIFFEGRTSARHLHFSHTNYGSHTAVPGHVGQAEGVCVGCWLLQTPLNPS